MLKLYRYFIIYINIIYMNIKKRYLNPLKLKLKNPKLRIGRSLVVILNTNSKFLTNSNEIFDDTKIEIEKNGLLQLKKASWIGYNVSMNASRVILGKYSAIHSFGNVQGDVSIGDYVMIAKNVFISSGRHHYQEEAYLPIKMQDKIYEKKNGALIEPVIIEDDVWIGVNCVIMPGIKIEKGAVIGSNSVVTKDIKAYSVNAGNPAKFIKNRYDFLPPKIISAMNKKDYPYFYSGFNIEKAPFLLKDNPNCLEAMSIFRIALTVGKERYLSMEIKSLGNRKSLIYMDQVRNIEEEYTTVTFQIEKNESDIYLFEEEDRKEYSEDLIFAIKKIFLHE